MMRLFILVVLLAAAGAAVFFLRDQTPTIVLTEGKAVAGADGRNYMVGLTMKNMDGPDRLLSVSSPGAEMATIMNLGQEAFVLVIPGEGTGVLAADGAHIMLRPRADDFQEGAFLPLTLVFENSGEVATRIQNVGGAMMDHDMSKGVFGLPAPEIALEWINQPRSSGFVVRLKVENFEFAKAEMGSPHVPNEGHAHAYLNGLKLGRIYTDTYQVGPLLPGDYVLRVSLNSNDHQPYLNADGPINASLSFSIR